MNMITNIIMKIEKSDFQLINNALITFKKDAGEGYPTMMLVIEKCSKKGFVLNNVDKIVLINVKMDGNIGDYYVTNNPNLELIR